MMIGAIVGMVAEAKLLPPSVRTVCSGGDPVRARQLAEQLLAEGADGLISFGIAGALRPGLPPGTLVVAERVMADGVVLDADPNWIMALRERLPSAIGGLIHGGDRVVADAVAKRALHEAGGAVAVDLESGAAAAACAAAGKPFAVLRTIADPAARGVPEAALVGLDAHGRTTPLKVLAALLRRPWDLPALIRVGLDTGAALRALGGAAGVVGPTLGFQPDQTLRHQ